MLITSRKLRNLIKEAISDTNELRQEISEDIEQILVSTTGRTNTYEDIATNNDLKHLLNVLYADANENDYEEFMCAWRAYTTGYSAVDSVLHNVEQYIENSIDVIDVIAAILFNKQHNVSLHSQHFANISSMLYLLHDAWDEFSHSNTSGERARSLAKIIYELNEKIGREFSSMYGNISAFDVNLKKHSIVFEAKNNIYSSLCLFTDIVKMGKAFDNFVYHYIITSFLKSHTIELDRYINQFK